MPRTNEWKIRSLGLVASGCATVIIGLIQFRHGIVHLLDTVTYWSGAQSVADGHFFTTTLSPSFSNFSALEFLQHNGRLPFVDFPIGYPLLSGILGAVIGTRLAMELLCILALAAIATGFICGNVRRVNDALTPIAMALIGVFVTLSPTMRMVTQGALSEPLFCAVTLWFVISLARFRHGGHWSVVAVLTIAASLLRFIGAPLAFLAGWERFRRTGAKGSSVLWTLGLMTPALANIIVAAANGGGHHAGWRGLDRSDANFFVRSLGGWFDARQGDLRRTYFTYDGPSWWSWLVTIAWLMAVVYALISILGRKNRMPANVELALASAGIMSVGLVAGMLGFDGLVIADNRLMLPMGTLTIAAISWSLAPIAQRFSAPKRSEIILMSILILLWTTLAVRPWHITESFSQGSGSRPYSLIALESGAQVIISNDADAVHWDTGLPAAYAPLPVQALTNEIIDIAPIYAALPCALLGAHGAVILSKSFTFFGASIDLLDAQVNVGRLSVEISSQTVIYWPTESACD